MDTVRDRAINIIKNPPSDISLKEIIEQLRIMVMNKKRVLCLSGGLFNMISIYCVYLFDIIIEKLVTPKRKLDL